MEYIYFTGLLGATLLKAQPRLSCTPKNIIWYYWQEVKPSSFVGTRFSEASNFLHTTLYVPPQLYSYC